MFEVKDFMKLYVYLLLNIKPVADPARGNEGGDGEHKNNYTKNLWYIQLCDQLLNTK